MRKYTVLFFSVALALDFAYAAGDLTVNLGANVSSVSVTCLSNSDGGLVTTTNTASSTTHEWYKWDNGVTVNEIAVADGYRAGNTIIHDYCQALQDETVTVTNDQATFTYSARNQDSVITMDFTAVPVTNSITYVPNSGTMPASYDKEYTVESADITLPTPSRNYYDFDGWYTNSDYSGSAVTVIPKGSTGDKTFHAKWTGKSYEVKLNFSGGWIRWGEDGEQITDSPFVTNYTYGVGLTLPAFGRIGYQGGGWHAYEDCSDYAINNIGSSDSGKKEFWAKLTKQVYEVKLDNQGADIFPGDSLVSVDYNATLKAIIPPERAGYVFQGYWSQVGGEGTQYYNADGSPCGNPWTTTAGGTIFAYWLPNSYTLSFDGGEGTGSMDPMSLTYGVETNLPKNLPPVGFEREGYLFAGWKTNLAGNVVFNDGQTVSNLTTEANGVVTMYALWSKGHYYVDFDANGGEGEMHVQEFTYDVPLALASNAFTRIGYDFAGWSRTENPTTNDVEFADGQELLNLVSDIDSTNTFYAVWSPEHYKVTLDAGQDGYFVDGEDTNFVVEAMVTYGDPYGTDLDYVTGGTNRSAKTDLNVSWVPTTKDDMNVGQSGNLPPDARDAYTYVRTTLPGPGVLTFNWRIYAPEGFWFESDSEESRFWGNSLTFVNATNESELVSRLSSGNDFYSQAWVDTGWQTVTLTNYAEASLPVEWRFEYANGKTGGGTGWVDNVTWTPAGGSRPVAAVTSYDKAYDGAGHGIEVNVTQPASGATVKYALDAEGPYAEGEILFTNVTETAETVWYTVEADGYATATNSGTVKISPKSLTDVMVSLGETSFIYDGSEKKPAVTVVDGEPSILTANDYDVAYSNNVEVGQATVAVTGKGNYAGEVLKHFTISPADDPPAPATIVHAVTSYDGTYDGAGHGITVSVTTPETGTVVKYALDEVGPYEEGEILFTNVTETAVTVWYTVEADGYATVTNSGTVKISPADDPPPAPATIVHAVTSYDGTYDGEGHGITVSVTTPESGAIVKYALDEAGPYAEEEILFTNETETAVTVWYTVEADGYATVTNSGTVKISPVPEDLVIPGYGTVTIPKTWKVDQKVTWKATAAKGSVFAHWEGDFVNSLNLSTNELRNPSLAFKVPENFDTNNIQAVFIAIDSDGLYDLTLTQTEFALKEPVSDVWVKDDSKSYVTASVSGLPTGLKFNAKTLEITGTPTKSGIYWVQVKAKNASGYQWAENFKVTVSGGGTEAKEPKLTRTPYYPLTVLSTNTAEGTVTGTGVYAEGKKASISAKPAKGYVFAGWYCDDAFSPAQQMEFASGDFRNASQSVIVVPEVRYLFARFATVGEDEASLKVNFEDVETEKDGTIGTIGTDGTRALDLGACVESLSLPKLTVTGLPTGLKYDAKTLKITGKATKPGVYTVKVAATNTSVKKATDETTATFTITVPNFESAILPGLWSATNAYGVVRAGVTLDTDLIDCTPGDGWTVKVTGLPTGLKFAAKDTKDATLGMIPAGTVYGVPTAKAGSYTVTFTASKKGEANQVATITLNIEALPAWAVGTFDGTVLTNTTSTPLPAGLVTLTVTANGKISGKLLEGGKTWTLSAAAYESEDEQESAFIATVVGKSGKEAITNAVKVAVDEEARSANEPYQRGVVSGWAASEPSVEWTAWQNLWKTEPWKTYAKPFANKKLPLYVVDGGEAGLVVRDAPPEEADVYGTIELKFAATGAVTASGKFVTGKNAQGRDVIYSVSCSSVLIPDSEVYNNDHHAAYLHFPLKAGKFDGYSVEVPLKWGGKDFAVEQ